MEEIKIQELLRTAKEAQDIGTQQIPVPPKKAESLYFFIYQTHLKSALFISKLSSSEGSNIQSLPYLLPNFALQPVTEEGNLSLQLARDEKYPFGVLGQLLQVKIESASKIEYHNLNIADLATELKQVGDVKEIPNEENKYLYKVSDLEDGPVFAMTRTDTIFSGKSGEKPSHEVCKTQGRDVVEQYYQFLLETFDQGTAFLGVNYLKSGFEQVIADPFVIKNIFDNFMSEIPMTDDFAYTFEKGSTEKLDFEIELEKCSGTSLFKIPELLNATGNFDWNRLTDFTQHHNKAV